MLLSIVLGLSVCASLIFFDDLFRAQMLVGVAGIVCFIAFCSYRKIHWSVNALFLYISFIILKPICFPQYVWPNIDTGTMAALQSMIEEAYIYFALIFVSFLIMSKTHAQILKKTFIVISIINTNVILAKQALGFGAWFLFNNPAFDAAFTSCTIPLLLHLYEKNYPHGKLKYLYKWMLIAPVLECLLSQSSTGIMGIGLSIGAYFLAKSLTRKKVLIISAALIVLISIGYVTQGEMLLNSSGRVYVWTIALKFWKGLPLAEHVFGTGPGTYLMIGPAIQINDAFAQGAKEVPGFIWMHSTPLQVLFETGFIGLGLGLLCWGLAVYRSRKTPELFSSLVTLFAVSCIQMPERHFIFAYFGSFLIISSASCFSGPWDPLIKQNQKLPNTNM